MLELLYIVLIVVTFTAYNKLLINVHYIEPSEHIKNKKYADWFLMEAMELEKELGFGVKDLLQDYYSRREVSVWS
jgi:hypothetical protein